MTPAINGASTVRRDALVCELLWDVASTDEEDDVLRDLFFASLLAPPGDPHARLGTLVGAVVVPLAGLWTLPVAAKPTAPALFCAELSDAPACADGPVPCTFCHGAPPQLNVFGAGLQAALQGSPAYLSQGYDAALPDALFAVGELDSDGDGVLNLREIESGSSPSVADGSGGQDALAAWDAEVAFRRVSVVFCGTSPTYEQYGELAQQADKKQAVHALLADCLESDYWRNEALHRMADDKIKPLEVVGLTGSIVLADYGWDYRLFSYVLSGDRDARDLLLADYHVTESGEVTRDVIARQSGFQFDEERISIGTGQPLPPERRAGMITTQWFIVMNTMFSKLPRTTASQAYRAYLGFDLAAGEGTTPVAGEPRDVDDKGVGQAACAACHSTLDPLAYAFSTYNGIEVDSPARSFSNADLIFFNILGAYDPARAPWEGEGYLFGEPVKDVNDWAKRAAESDAFKENLADMFFRHTLGRAPDATESDAFRALWQSLPEDGYSANKLIHRIVDLGAFGRL